MEDLLVTYSVGLSSALLVIFWSSHCRRDLSDWAENEPGQSRLTGGESERGPGAAAAGVVGSEQVMEVWECLLSPLTFVAEAS